MKPLHALLLFDAITVVIVWGLSEMIENGSVSISGCFTYRSYSPVEM